MPSISVISFSLTKILLIVPSTVKQHCTAAGQNSPSRDGALVGVDVIGDLVGTCDVGSMVGANVVGASVLMVGDDVLHTCGLKFTLEAAMFLRIPKYFIGVTVDLNTFAGMDNATLPSQTTWSNVGVGHGCGGYGSMLNMLPVKFFQKYFLGTLSPGFIDDGTVFQASTPLLMLEMTFHGELGEELAQTRRNMGTYNSFAEKPLNAMVLGTVGSTKEKYLVTVALLYPDTGMT